MFQLSLLSPDFMQHHSATSKTAISTSGKTTPSCGNNQAQSQLYQKTQLRKYILEQFAQEEETTFLQSFRQSIDTLQFQMQSFVQDAEYCTS